MRTRAPLLIALAVVSLAAGASVAAPTAATPIPSAVGSTPTANAVAQPLLAAAGRHPARAETTRPEVHPRPKPDSSSARAANPRRDSTTDGEAAASGPTIQNPIVVHSFDQTPIVATLMLPAGASPQNPVPAVLETHGWGGKRRTLPGGTSGKLLERGYAVLTWDSRGFGQSGGEVNVGAPEFEGRDAQALLDYLAARPEILQDGPGDPRVGWVGGSNAGAVQLNTAAIDHRVDAIAPEISWGNLVQDLVPNGVPKQSWDGLLYARGMTAVPEGAVSPAGTQTGAYAKEIHLGLVQVNSTGELSSDVQAWFAHRSTVLRSHQITAPTLIVQGMIDTLFPLEGAFANYRKLVDAGTPVKLIAYCAGHTVTEPCEYPGGASGYPDGRPDGALDVWQQRIIDWIEHHVGGKRHVGTGPQIEWQAQDGRYYGAPGLPLPHSEQVTTSPVSTGMLAGPGASGGDGPVSGKPAGDAELGRTAVRQVVLEADPSQRRVLLGQPRVHLDFEVKGLTAFAFLELVDVAPDGSRRTINRQTTPVRLGHGPSIRSVDLHGLAWIVEPGHALELEITTGSAQYAIPRTGAYTLSATAQVTLPLAPL